MAKRKERRWVIAGSVGLYVGQWILRSDAIKTHTYNLWSGRGDIPDLSEYGDMTDGHREAWKRCRKNGDRAIFATIIF